MREIELKEGHVILFQGDSITDCQRNYDDPYDLGLGYPMMVGAMLDVIYPQRHFTFYNRGHSGDRTEDLAARWQKDCIDLKPDIVSLLIGINDTKERHYGGRMDMSQEDFLNKFEMDYRHLLEEIRRKLDAHILLIEPFGPSDLDKVEYHKTLELQLEICRKLGQEYDVTYIDMDAIYADAIKKRTTEFWLPDRLHPSPQGHMLIAWAWLAAAGVTLG